MKTIVLFGAGKSATVLIDYLETLAVARFCHVIIADNNMEAIQSKLDINTSVQAVQLDILNETERKKIVSKADIVISLMPPDLHYLIAVDCVENGKHLLTASYISDELKALQKQVETKKILFLCEMGLDPGIDHMSAMQLIHSIQNKNGKITSFKSHCGGLVAPESDDNPWHYKISWNPRNIVMAGKAGAVYKENNKSKTKNYDELFIDNALVNIPTLGTLAYYPNRDSLGYIPLYKLEECETFLRTTLRHPDFCFGWKYIVDFKLTDEEKYYETTELSIAEFFKKYLSKDDLLVIKNSALLYQQFLFLGLNDTEASMNKGLCSVADIFQFILEKKLALQKDDKDMIVMMHEIEYEIENQKSEIKSWLIVKGEDNVRTAMAKTVGLPLGIAAKLLLENKIVETGLHIPIIKSIYEPVLNELKQHNIIFHEENIRHEK